MTQKEIDEATDVLCKVFDKMQEIVNLMNTLNSKQLQYVSHLYSMTSESIKLQKLMKEDTNER